MLVLVRRQRVSSGPQSRDAMTTRVCEELLHTLHDRGEEQRSQGRFAALYSLHLLLSLCTDKRLRNLLLGLYLSTISRRWRYESGRPCDDRWCACMHKQRSSTTKYHCYPSTGIHAGCWRQPHDDIHLSRQSPCDTAIVLNCQSVQRDWCVSEHAILSSSKVRWPAPGARFGPAKGLARPG